MTSHLNSPQTISESDEVISRLMSLRSDDELRKIQRYFPETLETADPADYFIGVRMGQVFALAREHLAMPVGEIETLMESPIHEVRAAAMSIMGQAAKSKKCRPERLAELYDLYLRRHDRVNNWDLVDLAAHYVVGPFLADKDRQPLYDLARSPDRWERRTSILATAHFIMKLKQTADTFALAEILIDDTEDPVNKATGWMLRTAGDVASPELRSFLDLHASRMPRVMLRNAIEKLPPDTRKYYLAL
jgi:3-methyladenine DNA glycosylase AlkD